jgi:hypothetical protein
MNNKKQKMDIETNETKDAIKLLIELLKYDKYKTGLKY